MMPQREAGEPVYEQADATYGRYEGDQNYAHQQFEAPYQTHRADKRILQF
jgi:hypothetical protein